MRIRTLIGPIFSPVTFVLLARLTPQNSSVMSEPFAQAVHDDEVLSSIAQHPNDVAADVAGAAGDQNPAHDTQSPFADAAIEAHRTRIDSDGRLLSS